MSATQRCLTIVKGEHRYVFRYIPGRESDVLASFVDMASDPECEFDWFDAAVLSYQMGQQLTNALHPVAPLD